MYANGCHNTDSLWLFLFRSVIMQTLVETVSRVDQALNVPDAASARQRSFSVHKLTNQKGEILVANTLEELHD
jgi:hypothetical protein